MDAVGCGGLTCYAGDAEANLPLSDTGFEALRAADLLLVFREEYEAELAAAGLPTDVSWSFDTFLGRISNVVARAGGYAAEGTQALWDAFDRNNATGLFLDNLGAMVNVTRNPATYSEATATLTGTDGTVVQAGKLVRDDAGLYWTITADATIGEVDAGEVDVVIRAADPGAVVLAPQTLTIGTPVAGWSGASTAASASVGDDLESDADYRQRIAASPAVSGGRNRLSLRADLLANVDGLTNVVILENVDDEEQVIEGVTIPGHGVAVYLWPQPLTNAQKTEVGRILYKQIPDGIVSVGDVDVTVTDTADGISEVVHFTFATEDPIATACTVVIDETVTTEADAEAGIIAAFERVAADLDVGETVRRLKVYAELDKVPGLLTVSALTLDGVAADYETTAVSIVTLDPPVVTFA